MNFGLIHVKKMLGGKIMKEYKIIIFSILFLFLIIGAVSASEDANIENNIEADDSIAVGGGQSDNDLLKIDDALEKDNTLEKGNTLSDEKIIIENNTLTNDNKLSSAYSNNEELCSDENEFKIEDSVNATDFTM